jgi:cell wall assembly regulator SMI1
MQSEWVELLRGARRPLSVRPGCSASEIENAESVLGVTIPKSLADFLKATDGFTDLQSHFAYAWDLSTIIAENGRAWSDPAMPLDRRLLAFGADGAGDWFCLTLDTPGESPVVHWGWIEGRPRCVADDLASFWRTWLDGSLSV